MTTSEPLCGDLDTTILPTSMTTRGSAGASSTSSVVWVVAVVSVVTPLTPGLDNTRPREEGLPTVSSPGSINLARILLSKLMWRPTTRDTSHSSSVSSLFVEMICRLSIFVSKLFNYYVLQVQTTTPSRTQISPVLMEEFWGLFPVERTGTTWLPSTPGSSHWNWGCQGTSGAPSVSSSGPTRYALID